MKQYSIRRHILGLLSMVAICCSQQAHALSVELLPAQLTIRNLMSLLYKDLGLIRSLQGAEHINSNNRQLQEYGASCIQSAQNAFARSRSWENYQPIPPFNWILNANFRNPWHVLLLATGTGLTIWGTYVAIKKIREKLRTPTPAAPAA
jgi:hypothetical protein